MKKTINLNSSFRLSYENRGKRFYSFGNIAVFENLSLCKKGMPLRLRQAVYYDYPVNLKNNSTVDLY